MNILLRLVVNALAVMVAAYVLPGVAVSSLWAALVVAVVLGLLNTFIKPILVVLTLPITVVTLGLFLFVINAAIVLLASSFVSGFVVTGFWSALLFSLVVSLISSLFHGMEDKPAVA